MNVLSVFVESFMFCMPLPIQLVLVKHLILFHCLSYSAKLEESSTQDLALSTSSAGPGQRAAILLQSCNAMRVYHIVTLNMAGP